MTLEYRVVDVFTQSALEGNPLAVFADARGLDTDTMQRIARELNLSETTFVFPPERGGDARVRIFTPRSEMEFAGHPTIGTAFVLRECGAIRPDARRIVLEENVGLVPVGVDDGAAPMLWLETPPIAWGRAFDGAACAAALGLSAGAVRAGAPCRLLSAGNPNVFVPLRDAAAVDQAEPDPAALARLFGGEPLCLFAFAAVPGGAYARMFAPALGILEDPATGSATGPLAAYMMRHGLMPSDDGTRIISEQGTKMGRRSLLHVRVRGAAGCDGIDVGGHCAPVAAATMTLPAGF